jgi:2-iminobutanoate/2-iminopropanoate deaminase
VSQDRRAVMSPDAPKPAGHYSHGVSAGGLLFCAGQLAIDPATNTMIEGSIGDRARQCLENLDSVCRAAGTSLQAAVRVGVFLTDMSDAPAVNEAYTSFFPGEPPARTTVAVAALPAGAPIEIDAVVALGD